MRIAFTTFGCKINQIETDQMRRAVASDKVQFVPFDDHADVYVINTCSVTSRSDYQCRQAIRSAVRRGNGAKVVVTGCYAQTNPGDIRSIPGVDLILDNSKKDDLSAHIEALISSNDALSAPIDLQSAGQFLVGRTRGFIKIQDGCDNRCSYCIVPLARGASRSIPYDRVIEEFAVHVDADCPEVVLSGIHIGKYGQDLTPRRSLTGLLETLLARRRNTRIRLSSIEPREITGEIIDMLGNGLCRHLHIPLQSGDDSILIRMNRDYSSAFYSDLLEDISRRVPGVALGADVMVGFPGEGDEEFNNTIELIKQSPLTHLHVFGFSPRPGTPAAEMSGQVTERVKKERSEVLRNLGNAKNHDFRRRFFQETLHAVIVGTRCTSTGCYSGVTDNYIKVAVLDAPEQAIGQTFQVKINNVAENITFAVLT